MPRRARLVVPGTPLHIIQRGNNRQACFYSDEDYRFYLDHLAEQSEQSGCSVHAYCLTITGSSLASCFLRKPSFNTGLF